MPSNSTNKGKHVGFGMPSEIFPKKALTGLMTSFTVHTALEFMNDLLQ